jgi:hypothetical protein
MANRRLGELGRRAVVCPHLLHQAAAGPRRLTHLGAAIRIVVSRLTGVAYLLLVWATILGPTSD